VVNTITRQQITTSHQIILYGFEKVISIMMFAVLLIIATMFPIPAVIGKGLFPEEMGQGVSSPPLETQSPCLPNSPLLWFFVAFLIVLLVASFFF